jgi:hypothetical protein
MYKTRWERRSLPLLVRLTTGGLALLCLLVGSSAAAAAIRRSDACQLLTRSQAENVFGTDSLPRQTNNLGTICEYRSGPEVLIVQIRGSDNSKTDPPFKTQPGSHEVTVGGVAASWRRAISPTRLNILAFRKQTALVEIALSPSVVGAEPKAKKAMADVLVHLHELR